MTVTRIRIAAAIAVTGAALTLAGCGTADESKPATATTSAQSATEAGELPVNVPEFIIRAGERVSGPSTLEVKSGATVKFTIISDVDDELHIHGYDKTIPLTSGEFATVEFTADIPGKFEIELHDTGSLVTTLQVNG